MKRFLTINEVAEFTGFSISKINKLINKNKIPSYLKEGKRLFDSEEITWWIKGVDIKSTNIT